MATIFVNGCFDLLHEGHRRFLLAAKHLGRPDELIEVLAKHLPWHNRLIVAVNSDRYARDLKQAKWGEKYPVDDLLTRMKKLAQLADSVIDFDNEQVLHGIIEYYTPCIICKGPDYAGKRVTGDDIAPVIILDTPETEEVRQFKRKAYML